MKVKVILKSLLFSYAVTGAFLLFLAFLLFQFDLGEKPVSAGIVAVYILSCFSGGFMSGKILRKDKYLWGILVGDADNDIAAMKKAGLAVAMKNANEHVKALADVIVSDNDHDGCREVLQNYGFIR